MKKTMVYLAGIYMLLSFAITNKEAEQFMQHMKLCAAEMQKQKQTDLEINYQVFHSHVSNIAAETAKGRFCRQGDQVYYTLMGTTIVQDGKTLVVCDDSSKTILVQKAGNRFDPVSQQIDLKKIQAYTKSIAVKESKKGLVHYQVEMKDNEVKTLGIEINTATMQVEKMQLYYAHESEIIEPSGQKHKVLPRMEISYRKPAKKYGADIFSTAKLIKKTKKGFEPMPAYKKYQVIDYYNQKTR